MSQASKSVGSSKSRSGSRFYVVWSLSQGWIYKPGHVIYWESPGQGCTKKSWVQFLTQKKRKKKRCRRKKMRHFVLSWVWIKTRKGRWPMIESLELQFFVSLGVGGQQHVHETLPCHMQELSFKRESILNMINVAGNVKHERLEERREEPAHCLFKQRWALWELENPAIVSDFFLSCLRDIWWLSKQPHGKSLLARKNKTVVRIQGC